MDLKSLTQTLAGPAGVVGGVAALKALKDAGFVPARPIEVGVRELREGRGERFFFLLWKGKAPRSTQPCNAGTGREAGFETGTHPRHAWHPPRGMHVTRCPPALACAALCEYQPACLPIHLVADLPYLAGCLRCTSSWHVARRPNSCMFMPLHPLQPVLAHAPALPQVVMFTSEEPTRFGLSCSGSRAMAGARHGTARSGAWQRSASGHSRPAPPLSGCWC